LPSGTIPAAKNQEDYIRRLTEANAKLTDPKAVLLTWGFHHYFHGKLTRTELDKISTTRPIIVWHRSAHEFIVNTAALQTFGVTAEFVSSLPQSARDQSDFDEGHFWEQGLFGVLGKFAPAVASPERLNEGLQFVEKYLQANGVTVGCEPGGLLSKKLQDAQNAVFSDSGTPFRYYFIADGKSLTAAHADDKVIAQTEKLASWYGGMTSLAPKQAKLFADGAIYSLAMQVREPFLDGHKGEWMMDEEVFNRAFRVYWDAGYQIHIHVNGDAGLDRVLGALETNLRRNPRHDHRTVLVHFAVSDADQLLRIKTLGAIVSGNPYYVSALADQYGKVGLGPERADEMVRLGDLTRADIRWSLHSDMPMAPADPLFLMWCAVNRLTTSGRVAAPEQRVSAEQALRGITIEAAHSLKLENEIGSIAPGKRANFTVLSDNPLRSDPLTIREIGVWGTVMEGRVLPAPRAQQKAERRAPAVGGGNSALSEAALHHAVTVAHAFD